MPLSLSQQNAVTQLSNNLTYQIMSHMENFLRLQKTLIDCGIIGITFGSTISGNIVTLPGGRNASASQTLALLIIASGKIKKSNYHRSAHSGYYLCDTEGMGAVCWYTRQNDIPYMYGIDDDIATDRIREHFPEFTPSI